MQKPNGLFVKNVFFIVSTKTVRLIIVITNDVIFFTIEYSSFKPATVSNKI